MQSEKNTFLLGFSDIDNAYSPEQYINCLKAINEDYQTVLERKKVLSLLSLKHGDNLLDVGCGTGGELNTFVSETNSTCRYTGIDKSLSLIESAKKNYANDSINFEVMDAHQLRFVDESFDAAKSERCFSYLENPNLALSEMKRVTKRGGKVLIHDNDWENFIIASNFPDVSKMVKHHYFNFVKNGDMGRQLYRLFKLVGMSNIIVEFTPYYYTDYHSFSTTFHLESILIDAIESDLLPKNMIAEWIDDLKRSNESGEFFAYGTGIIVYGNA